jgi:glycosyltransferase involved in cell wall biosynthesis
VKIVHIITSLTSGGAESILLNLVINDKLNKHIVIVLKDRGVYGDLIEKSNIVFFELNMRGLISSVRGVVDLFSYLNKIRPDIVQTWLFHADLIGGVVSKLSGVRRVFWGVHTANIKLLPFSTKIVVRCCSILSYFIPDKIICCAKATQQVLSDNFYCASKLIIINNGYDVEKFSPNGEALNIKMIDSSSKSENFLIGFVARWNIYKDIPTLLSALKQCTMSNINIKCYFVGANLDVNNTKLTKLIKDSNLTGHAILLGHMDNIPSFMRAMDICILSSVSEAFPNVIVESMLCGTPCVSTYVGDVGSIIKNTGWVSLPSDSKALATSIVSAANEKTYNRKEWDLRREQCRKRAVNSFSIDKMISNYITTWSGG